MKCPICHKDHYMICHSCPHNGQLQGLAYEGSPCEVCAKDAQGGQRANDSRETGHGRVVSLDAIERYVADSMPNDGDGEGTDDRGALRDALCSFVKRFCGLDIRIQFILEERVLFGNSLEEVAHKYCLVFGKTLTPAGVAAALKSARARILSSAT